MLPKISGVDVCRDLRARSRVPIIMVTARNSEIDAVVGLEVGADDYVTKPFRLRELIARVRAALRRVPASDDDEPDRPEVLEVGDVRLDAGRHEVFVRGESVALPLKEFELLELLMANAGRVLTRDVLIDRIWGPNYFGDTKTLDVHIKRLRSKLEPDSARPTRIVTVRGVGYRYERAAPADRADDPPAGADFAAAFAAVVGLGARQEVVADRRERSSAGRRRSGAGASAPAPVGARAATSRTA